MYYPFRILATTVRQRSAIFYRPISQFFLFAILYLFVIGDIFFIWQLMFSIPKLSVILNNCCVDLIAPLFRYIFL